MTYRPFVYYELFLFYAKYLIFWTCFDVIATPTANTNAENKTPPFSPTLHPTSPRSHTCVFPFFGDTCHSSVLLTLRRFFTRNASEQLTCHEYTTCSWYSTKTASVPCRICSVLKFNTFMVRHSHTRQCLRGSGSPHFRSIVQPVGMGDRRPSQLLRDMRSVLPGDAALKEFWLQKLPPTIAGIISGRLGGTLESLAECADRVADANAGRQVSTIATSHEPDRLRSIVSAISAFTVQISALATSQLT